MKKLFFATTNKFKINNMKNRLESYGIQIITPYDLNINLDIEEDGNTVIENSKKKALAYYEKVNMPTIATDSSLYVEKFKNQPGLFVRRVNGITLSDDELENYYIDELNKVGGKSNAYYITGVVLVLEGDIKSIEIKEDQFIFTSNLCLGTRNADPLSRLEYDEELNKYFCELTKEEVKSREYSFDKQVIEFITENI